MKRHRAVAMLLWLLAAGASAVEVNTASQAQLEALPGIGVAMTERILAERDAGSFRDWADLMRRVKGVKQSTAARLSAAGLTVGGTALPAASAASAPR